MHKTILITLCCLQVWALNAQISDLRGGGAYTAGQARMSSVLHADDALFGNIAAMPFSNNKYMIDASGERRFGFEDLSLYNLGGVYQFGNAAAGFQLVDFGDIDYKERKFQASYAMQLAEAFSMGVSFNFLQLSIAEYGQSFTPTIDFGIYTRVLPDIHVGAHVQNLLQANKETVSYPSVLTLGASYSASDKVDFKIEAEKILDRSLAVKAGIVYTPVPACLHIWELTRAENLLPWHCPINFHHLNWAGHIRQGPDWVLLLPSVCATLSPKQVVQGGPDKYIREAFI